ncbi:D-alanyl-D-alanine endopeptidase [Pragia fontium]|uniref:D-alanyl-D-alanine endopeptidase (Penicillin-binding protein 7) n=2 Tax=Pragia fontium TaxID=82985 RepID=A0AAJ4W9A9_9GAMM|nr:D-alanyl-D-alanine endopeptidase [Pragia fontium]GKX61986.1 D-alanyl-D-alanine endopeptidase [Pragia fontium]SFC44055.1 D-alanyl-D-alanine endopeptidase (penicillin-binding protein 7) [Pragia fontium DSM 5563 = ATCC 49100]VEJ54952.1 D-alanyl-D-alanine endopeptidase precursor [Pragia fontium]
MRTQIRFTLLSLAIFTSGFLAATTVSAKNTHGVSQSSPAKPELSSKSALVVDIQSRKVLYSSNPDKVVPIASLTKLMTAMVVLDAKQPLTQVIPVKINETKELRGVFSRVKVGSEITRKEMLLLALMSSENRAAASLAHNYPGGYRAFIKAMNAKAKSLGMKNTRYVEPTGLSEKNVSTARDLSRLVIATKKYPMLSQLSTTEGKTVSFENPRYTLEFHNTNHLIRNHDWKIQLTKTGYTDEAGRCLTMRTTIGNREVALVMLDAYGKYTHFADANRLRNWMESGQSLSIAEVSNKNTKKQKAKSLRQG